MNWDVNDGCMLSVFSLINVSSFIYIPPAVLLYTCLP